MLRSLGDRPALPSPATAYSSLVPAQPAQPAPAVVPRAASETSRADARPSGVNKEIRSAVIAKLQVVQQGVPTTGMERSELTSSLEAIIADGNHPLTKTDADRLVGEIVAEAVGLGPLEELLQDPDINEIMVVGHGKIFVEHRD